MDSVIFVITIGLPGTGKSTWARAWRAADPSRRLLVSRDEFRLMLFGKWPPLSPEHEDAVTRAEVSTVSAMLRAGFSVCAHDTNLDPAKRTPLTVAATYLCPVVFRDFRHVPLEQVLAQNERRAGTGAYVPPETIRDMARRHGLPAPVPDAGT